MMATRRSFLTTALGVAALPLLPSLAFARAARMGRRERRLVLLDLAGGNDGLNTVVPFADPAYIAARPTLRLTEKELLPLRPGLGLRRELAALHPRFEAGELAIVQGVGYPRPDRSHFRSTDIWHTASLTPEQANCGWLARVGELPEVVADGRLPALMVGGGSVPLLLHGARGPAPQVDSFSDLEVASGPGDGKEGRVAAMAELANGEGDRDALRFLREATRATHAQSAQVARAAKLGRTTASYPDTPLGRSLQLVAQLLAGELDCSAYYARQDGYDTHAFQADAHAFLLRDLGDSLGAFWADVAALGATQEVLVMVSSEFGRRVAENGSKGTDHGAAAPLLLLGGAVAGGMHGPAPDLRDLEDGDVKYGVDFRRVYATLLAQWFEVDAAAFLAESFAPLPLLRRRE